MIPCTFPAPLLLALALSAAPQANAADDFLAAANSFHEPDDRVFEGFDDPGHEVSAEQLQEALRSNEAALVHLRAGLDKPRCEFPPDPAAPALGPSVPALRLMKLGKLLILRGRDSLRRGEASASAADYLDALALASALGRVPHLIAGAVAAEVELRAAAALQSLAESAPDQDFGCAAVKRRLHAHQQRRPPVATLVEAERAEAGRIASSLKPAFERNDGRGMPLWPAFQREFEHRIDAIYAAHRAYATTHRPQDREAVARALRRMQDEKKTAVERLKPVFEQLSRAEREDLGKVAAQLAQSDSVKSEEIPALLAAIMTGALAFDLTATIDRWLEASAALGRLETALNTCR